MKQFYYLFILASMLFSFSGNAQVYYSENFEAGDGNWVFTDLNSDGSNFDVLNAGGINAALGSGSLVSFSWYNNVAYNVNNMATSPAIDLTGVTASNVYFSYQYFTDPSYPADHYAVYVTTSSTPATIIATTPVFEETPVANQNLVNRAIDLTAYIGQTVYLSFRHFNTYDQYFLIIDNIEVSTLPNNDVQLTNVDLARYGTLGSQYPATMMVKNLGINAITSITASWTDGTSSYEQTIPVNIPMLGTSEVTFPTNMVSYDSVVEKDINFQITMVNGNSDSDSSNNSLSKLFNTVSVDSPKKVLLEEGSGTWCGYCPRGMVAMEQMYNTHSDKFVGIVVHNQDPMTVAEYDNGADFNAFPGMNVDRLLLGESVSYNTMESTVLDRYQLKVPASLSATGSVSGATATINAQAMFYTNFAAADFRLAVVMSENEVTGTTSGYNQANYYSGSTTPLGGYENLPNPVPAAQMVYDHVGVALLGGYDGQSGSVPTAITDGTSASYTFNYTIPDTSDATQMYANVLLIDNASGEVVNVESFSLENLGTDDIQSPEFSFNLYPNPVVNELHVNLDKPGKHEVSIYNASGQMISSNDYDFDGDSIIVPVDQLKPGVYMISVATEGESFNTKFIKN